MCVCVCVYVGGGGGLLNECAPLTSSMLHQGEGTAGKGRRTGRQNFWGNVLFTTSRPLERGWAWDEKAVF